MKYLLKLGNLSAILILCLTSRAQTNYQDYITSGNIFADDFSTNKIGWVTGVSSDNCYNSKIEDGAFVITSACKGIYPGYWMSPVIDVTRDFEIEAAILYVQGESDNGISLVWGKDENYNLFNFSISGDGHFKIFQYNGNFINLKDWSVPESFNKTDYNILTVRKIDANYYFFINDKLVHTSDFYPFYGNQIGFQDNQNTTMKVNFLKVSYIKPNPGLTKTNEPATNAGSKKALQPYIGISADYILLTGSFDGKSFFQTTDETILVPKLSPSIGFGVQFGVKIGNGALDFAYHISRMEYTSMVDGFSGKSTNHFIRYLGFKRYFNSFEEKKVKPYLDFDLSMSFSHFEKISYSLNNQSDYKSANYGGVIIGAGIGSLINLTKNLALDFKVLPEVYIGTDVKPEGGTDYTIKKFNNFLLINSFGLNYYFF